MRPCWPRFSPCLQPATTCSCVVTSSLRLLTGRAPERLPRQLVAFDAAAAATRAGLDLHRCWRATLGGACSASRSASMPSMACAQGFVRGHAAADSRRAVVRRGALPARSEAIRRLLKPKGTLFAPGLADYLGATLDYGRNGIGGSTRLHDPEERLSDLGVRRASAQTKPIYASATIA